MIQFESADQLLQNIFYTLVRTLQILMVDEDNRDLFELSEDQSFISDNFKKLMEVIRNIYSKEQDPVL